MSDWKQCLLGSIAEVQTGPFGSQLKNEQYITGGTPVITVEHINAFRIQNIDYPSVTEDDRQRLARYSLNAGDIVFTRVGSVDLSAYVKPENQGWLFSSRMLRVRISTVEVDSLFLSYFFRQEKFREYILNIAVGATMPSINTQILKDIPISYPPLPEQKAIASVLSSLDDKIDLLHRQNKTLEAMAETLFRQWFIEEAKEDWEVKPLSSIISTTSGYVRKPTDIDGEAKLLSMGVVPKFFGMNDSAYKPIDGKHIVPHHKVSVHDLIISTRDVTQDAVFLGAPAIIPSYRKDEDLYIGANLFKLELTNPDFGKWSLYCLLRSFPFREYVRDVASGTSVLMLKKSDFLQYEIKYPRPNYLREMEADLAPIFEKLDTNLTHLMTVKKLRDTLLPKLMSGEVRVQ